MDKKIKIVLQVAMTILVIAVEIIVTRIVWSSVFIFPSSPLLDALGLGAFLNNMFEAITNGLYIWQAVVLLIISIIYTLRNHYRINNGKATLNSQRIIMYVFIALNVIIAATCLSGTTITRSYSLYSLVVPGFLLVTGILHTVLSIRFYGPNYGL